MFRAVRRGSMLSPYLPLIIGWKDEHGDDNTTPGAQQDLQREGVRMREGRRDGGHNDKESGRRHRGKDGPEECFWILQGRREKNRESKPRKRERERE